MVWSSIPWNWVIPLIVLVFLLLLAIALACLCKFGCKKTPRHSDPKIILHNIDSVEVISNPTCATVFVPVDGKIFGNVIEDGEVDLGLGTNKKTFSTRRQKKSKTDRVAAANAHSSSIKRLVNSHMDHAFTNPESDISLVPMDYRGNACRDYHNAVDVEQYDTSETSESAPMIPSTKK